MGTGAPLTGRIVRTTPYARFFSSYVVRAGQPVVDTVFTTPHIFIRRKCDKASLATRPYIRDTTHRPCNMSGLKSSFLFRSCSGLVRKKLAAPLRSGLP